MEINLDELEVTHNKAENRFETRINGQLSKLDYLLDGTTLVITHVGVHLDLRGQGIAGRLTQAALDYAAKNALRVVPMCPYAAAYIRRHPRYQELMKS